MSAEESPERSPGVCQLRPVGVEAVPGGGAIAASIFSLEAFNLLSSYTHRLCLASGIPRNHIFVGK